MGSRLSNMAPADAAKMENVRTGRPDGQVREETGLSTVLGQLSDVPQEVRVVSLKHKLEI